MSGGPVPYRPKRSLWRTLCDWWKERKQPDEYWEHWEMVLERIRDPKSGVKVYPSRVAIPDVGTLYLGSFKPDSIFLRWEDTPYVIRNRYKQFKQLQAALATRSLRQSKQAMEALA